MSFTIFVYTLWHIVAQLRIRLWKDITHFPKKKISEQCSKALLLDDHRRVQEITLSNRYNFILGIITYHSLITIQSENPEIDYHSLNIHLSFNIHLTFTYHSLITYHSVHLMFAAPAGPTATWRSCCWGHCGGHRIAQSQRLGMYLAGGRIFFF